MERSLYIILSDIHVKDELSSIIEEKLTSFKGWLKNKKRQDNYENILIIISGDIAFSGKKEQYEHVLSIFDDVKLDYNFVISPGNHDHDFSSYVGEMRNILLD
ncbi:metallophosphoesterase family protein [Vibrio tarriae]|uniref:metallophosphoesterase family protein n=2 Tax=Vibrio tarriae TaxID=2014742 RepID=UPI0015EFBC05|nr:metallophosphoesterase [Vibrio tarriae]